MKSKIRDRIVSALRAENDYLRIDPTTDSIVVIGKDKEAQEVFLGSISQEAWYQLSDEKIRQLIDRIRFTIISNNAGEK